MMNKNRTILLSLVMQFLITASVSADEFAEQFGVSVNGINRLANRVTAIYLQDQVFDQALHKQELEHISQQIDDAVLKDPANEVVYFIAGMHYRNVASFFQRVNKSSLGNSYIDKKNEMYSKALLLHEKRGSLTAAMLSVMKHGLPANEKQKAIQAELDLGGNGENDSYYWYLHWSNINELQKMQRFDEADAALAKMKAELKAQGQEKSAFQQLVDKAQKNLSHVKQLVVKEQTRHQQKSKPEKNKKSSFAESEYFYFILVVLLIIGILAIVVVLEIRRRGKNRR